MSATGSITRDDLEAKFRELSGEVEETAESAKSYAIVAGAIVVAAVIGVAFILGKRRGKKKRTIVEIRRV